MSFLVFFYFGVVTWQKKNNEKTNSPHVSSFLIQSILARMACSFDL